MTNKDALLKRIHRLAGDNKKPKTIIWIEGEPEPKHGPRDHIITGVDKNGHLL